MSVGGQAVLEGVMMRAPQAWAVAVRKPDGEIEATRHELPRLSSRSRLATVPFVRGVLVLGESLTLGFRALSWSAQKSVGEEEEELSKKEIAGSLAIALVLFAGLFIVLPAAAAGWIVQERSEILFVVLEAVIRLALFVGYIWAIGRSQEIRRVFRYHGAEHMAIHAFEAGEPLSIDSVERYRPEHPRCGTSFLLIVILLAIVVFSFVGQPGWFWLIVSRVLGIPVIAGISYELLKWSGTHGGERMARILAAPGLWLQRLTTGVPDEEMIEVAVTSLLSALTDDQVEEVTKRGPLPEAAVAARAR
jgi:uncharacterized protein YqhQ